jgi:heme/copper-type cytochrome/quinol oxidase subunit 2
MLNEKFTNNTVNIILILSTIGLILIISKIYAVYTLMEHLSNNENIEESTVHTYQDNKEYKILAFFWLTVQALLMVLIAYTGYRTGRNIDPTTLNPRPITKAIKTV